MKLSNKLSQGVIIEVIKNFDRMLLIKWPIMVTKNYLQGKLLP